MALAIPFLPERAIPTFFLLAVGLRFVVRNFGLGEIIFKIAPELLRNPFPDSLPPGQQAQRTWACISFYRSESVPGLADVLAES